MNEDLRWFVGLDWAKDRHRVVVIDGEGKGVAERDVAHSGAGLSELCTWLVETTGAQAAEIAVAIEAPRGPVVEALLEHGFAVFGKLREVNVRVRVNQVHVAVYFSRDPTSTSSWKPASTGRPSGPTEAATIIPFDSTPRNLRGARFVTTTTFRPISAVGS